MAQNKEIQISAEVYEKLEERAKELGLTLNDYTDQILTREKEAHIHHQLVRCPECSREIIMIWNKPTVISLREFQKRTREMLKRERKS